MSEARIEINKSQEPVFKEAEKTEQKSLLKNSGMEMLNDVSNKQALIPDIENKIEDSYIEEKSVKKKGKTEDIPAGPKHIAFEERFTYDRIDDSTDMKDVRRKLRYYYESLQKGDTNGQVVNLHKLVKECDSYLKGKFSIFKWGRARERLKEVKELKREANKKLAALPKNFNGLGNIELIHNTGGYVSNLGAAVVVGRFLIENPIRIALTAIALPFWAVNECIRGVQKAMVKTPNRRLRLPWMHRWGYYIEQQLAKRKAIGFAKYRSFAERFLKHKTDIKAMDRADMDYLSAVGSISDDDDDDDEDDD